MRTRNAALIALAGFALGVFVGKGPTVFETDSTTDTLEPVTGMASVRAAPAANASAMVPGAAARARSTDLIAQADDLRRQRRFKEAAEAYRHAAASGRMNADSWADYADALASAGSSLKGAPADALAQALALDPRHPKALWLKASLEHEEHHYHDAVSTWRNLLAVVPANSSDARIIEANIAEASRLASGQG